MFWNWFFMILYSIAACCGIANMAMEKVVSHKIFRTCIAVIMFIMAILYGNTIVIESLGV